MEAYSTGCLGCDCAGLIGYSGGISNFKVGSLVVRMGWEVDGKETSKDF